MLEAECSAYAFDMRCDEMVGISSITRYGTVGSCVAAVVATLLHAPVHWAAGAV